MTLDEVIATFGLDPNQTGNRPRSWWIVEEPDDEDKLGNAERGFLCVRTRDGASNPISMEALQKPNCVGTVEDGFDQTYRYYYYRPLGSLQATSKDGNDAA